MVFKSGQFKDMLSGTRPVTPEELEDLDTALRRVHFPEDAEQLAKVESASDELPKLEHVLTYHDLAGLAGTIVPAFEVLDDHSEKGFEAAVARLSSEADVLAAHLVRAGRIGPVDDHLGDPVAVPQVEEDQGRPAPAVRVQPRQLVVSDPVRSEKGSRCMIGPAESALPA